MRYTTDPLMDPLPEPLADLVQQIKANHPDTGGSNREALAMLQARLAWSQVEQARRSNEVASGLRFATWALVGFTAVLSVVTFVSAFIVRS